MEHSRLRSIWTRLMHPPAGKTTHIATNRVPKLVAVPVLRYL